MKRLLTRFFLLVCIVIADDTMAQSKQPKKQNHPSGKQYSVSLGANLPVGNFSSTHVIGIELNHAWSNHRFGQMDVKPVKPVGFIGEMGAAYYFGKKERIIDYYYNYPSYIFIDAYAGIIINPWRKGHISFSAGPAIGLYDGNKKFNISSKLEGSYYFSKTIGITPGIILMKESGVDPLWSASLKAIWVF